MAKTISVATHGPALALAEASEEIELLDVFESVVAKASRRKLQNTVAELTFLLRDIREQLDGYGIALDVSETTARQQRMSAEVARVTLAPWEAA